MIGDRERLVAERDGWVRLFNRLEAAVAHHEKDKGDNWVDEVDDALYAARDRIVKDAVVIVPPAPVPAIDRHSTTVDEAAAFERDNHA